MSSPSQRKPPWINTQCLLYKLNSEASPSPEASAQLTFHFG